MDNTFNFCKELPLNTKIYEITSISFEHDYIVGDYEINGNFVISGEYRISEISVTKEKFHFNVPFNIELNNDIDLSTITLEVNDFTYDLINDEVIKAAIEVIVKGQIVNNPPEEVIFKDIEEELRNDETEEIEEIEEIIEDEKEEILDGFIKYHVHIVKQDESLDLIAQKYHKTILDLEDYNDISDIKVGDKLIIPQDNE